MSNPYAYYEENLPVRQAEIGFDETADTGEGTTHEPRVPIVLPLKRGMFGGHVTLEATRDQCEISGEALPEPIVVLRDEAAGQLRMKSNKLVVRTSDGRKYSFRYRRDKQQELWQARLETWCRQRWHDAAAGAYESVSELLKKHVIRTTLHNMIALTVLQGLPVLLMLFWILMAILQQPGFDLVLFALVGLLVYAIPAFVTFALAVALGMRQIWAIYATMVLSFVPLGFGMLMLIGIFASLNGAIPMNPDAFPTMIAIVMFLILIPVVVIVTCIRAVLRYHSLKAAMDDDQYQQRFQSSGVLFDKNNHITIDLS